MITVALVALVVASWFVVALLARALHKRKPASRGTFPGAGSHDAGGSGTATKSTIDSDELAKLVRLKGELLAAWAREGETIDILTEAKAELVAIEVTERGAAWRNLGELATGQLDLSPPEEPPPLGDAHEEHAA